MSLGGWRLKISVAGTSQPCVSTVGSTVATTMQPGEPAHAGSSANHSIWWEWTAGVSQSVTIDTAGSSFDTVLAVYTGSSVSNLTVIASNDDAADGGATSQVVFDAIAGTPYLIAVDGFEGDFGDVQLNVSSLAPPPLQFGNVQRLLNGQFCFKIDGTPTQLFVLQTSTNLMVWQSISTNQCAGAASNFTVPTDPNSSARFYRAIQWP